MKIFHFFDIIISLIGGFKMDCYYCAGSAHGQCMECGRFICRDDSMIYRGKLCCSKCYSTAENFSFYNQAKQVLLGREVGKCEVCKKGLISGACIDVVLDKFTKGGLNSEDWAKLKREFSTYHGCESENKCLLCEDHSPIHLKAEYIHNYQIRHWKKCPACGETYSYDKDQTL